MYYSPLIEMMSVSYANGGIFIFEFIVISQQAVKAGYLPLLSAQQYGMCWLNTITTLIFEFLWENVGVGNDL